MIYIHPRMWLTLGRHPVVKHCSNTLNLTLLERGCYEGEVQSCRKTDYTPMMIHTYVILVMWFFFKIGYNNKYQSCGDTDMVRDIYGFEVDVP